MSTGFFCDTQLFSQISGRIPDIRPIQYPVQPYCKPYLYKTVCVPDPDEAAGGGAADNQRPGALQGALQIYFQGTFSVHHSVLPARVLLRSNLNISNPKTSRLVLIGFPKFSSISAIKHTLYLFLAFSNLPFERQITGLHSGVNSGLVMCTNQGESSILSLSEITAKFI